VILVGHSSWGAMIAEAGADPKVRSLVYVDAFAADAGESVAKLAEAPVPGAPQVPLLPPQDGRLIVDPLKFTDAVAADVDASTTAFRTAAQLLWGFNAVRGAVPRAVWKFKPGCDMVAQEDRIVPPTRQRMMARRAGAPIREVRSSPA
jgi:pimeloyl-ACP methyl ester carboxylesterase